MVWYERAEAVDVGSAIRERWDCKVNRRVARRGVRIERAEGGKEEAESREERRGCGGC